MEKSTGRGIIVYWLKMSKKVVREGYNKAAWNYFENRDKFKSDKYLKELVERLNDGDKVLDVGCGSGRPVAGYLADQGMEIEGVDISEEQIKLARKQVPGGKFEVKDMEQLKEGEYQVEAVVSFYALFHIDRKKHVQVLKKLASFLPDGGWLLITMGADEWEGEEDFMGTRMWWSHWGEEKNKKLIEQAGFEIRKEWIDRTGGEKHLIILAVK